MEKLKGETDQLKQKLENERLNSEILKTQMISDQLTQIIELANTRLVQTIEVESKPVSQTIEVAKTGPSQSRARTSKSID